MNPFWRAKNKVNTPKKTLIIIDMQESFVSSADRIAGTVCGLVRHAKKEQWPIIIVEITFSGKTLQPILEEIGPSYELVARVQKSKMDGGAEIIECIEELSWPLHTVVCGVYGDQCVSHTVSGLFENSSLVEVDVVTDAVDPGYISRCNFRDGEREVVSTEIIDHNIVLPNVWVVNRS